MQNDGVLVLIAAWNEAQRVEQVISGLPDGIPILVVDDGSSDGTAEVARASGVNVLIHRVNQGKGAALMSGFR